MQASHSSGMTLDGVPQSVRVACYAISIESAKQKLAVTYFPPRRPPSAPSEGSGPASLAGTGWAGTGRPPRVLLEDPGQDRLHLNRADEQAAARAFACRARTPLPHGSLGSNATDEGTLQIARAKWAPQIAFGSPTLPFDPFRNGSGFFE